jgi:hypothetical protein
MLSFGHEQPHRPVLVTSPSSFLGASMPMNYCVAAKRGEVGSTFDDHPLARLQDDDVDNG